MGHRGISTSMHVSAKSVTIFCALHTDYVRISTSLVVCIMMIQKILHQNAHGHTLLLYMDIITCGALHCRYKYLL